MKKTPEKNIDEKKQLNKKKFIIILSYLYQKKKKPYLIGTNLEE
jgi:hypothetical protein